MACTRQHTKQCVRENINFMGYIGCAIGAAVERCLQNHHHAALTTVTHRLGRFGNYAIALALA